jgi:hypothetical protein
MAVSMVVFKILLVAENSRVNLKTILLISQSCWNINRDCVYVKTRKQNARNLALTHGGRLANALSKRAGTLFCAPFY